METVEEEIRIKRYFFWSVLIKGAISIAEVAGGLLVLVAPPALIGAFASTTVVGIFLLTRGLIKVGLIAALLKNQYWAYPASLVILSLFIIYQTYEIIVGHSLLFVAITAFDLVVVYFIWREYQILQEHRPKRV